MINDAEKFADEDAALKSKVEARNELESYAYSLKNQLSDKEKLGGKLSDDEQSKIEEVINEKIAWLEENQDALRKILKHKRRKWRILSSLLLQNYTRDKVDLLQRMVAKKMMNSKTSCSCDIFR